MYEITYFKGNHTNTKGGQVWGFDEFTELAEEFSRCAKGAKHSAYIVRGKLANGERKDVNMKSSKLLVIDGDEGLRGKPLCSPKDVHSALCDMGINHFIYTSHSHSEEQNKFRVIIASEEYTKADLRANNKLVLKELALRGCKIKYVKEMNAWSQPWFVPTRDNPKDGLFEYYNKTDGNDWKVTKDEQETETESKKTETQADSSGDIETLDEMHENIRTGREYHESLRTLSYQYIKDGMSSANTKALLRALLNGSKDAGSERWQTRYKDIDRLVDGAVNRAEEESADFDMPDTEVEEEDIGDMPIPPGLMGDLYQSAYNSLLYQYPEVALVSSLGLLAGICGRKFNVMEPAPSGLNLFLTIVAGTGFGKESISTFINKCVRGTGGLKEHRSFIGPSNFTGPKAIVNSFLDARSRVCVVSEAGLMMKVKSGNVEGKTAFILDAFSSSHRDGYTKESSYSSKDDYVAEIRAMAISIISESTEDHMIEAYRTNGSLVDGHLPRQLVFKIDKRQTKINRAAKFELSDAVKKRLGDLMAISALVQSEEDSDAVEVFFSDDIREDLFDYITKYNVINEREKRGDPVKHNMSTRVAQKATRLACLCAVFNGEKEISKESWEWAKAVCDYEFGRISGALSGLTGSADMDNGIVATYGKMTAIINGSIVNRKCGITKQHKERKIIPYSILRVACEKVGHITELNDSGKGYKYKSGLDKILSYMEESGAIGILDKDPLGSKSPKLVQIKEGILEFMSSYQ
jgi:hypothetical protein